MLVGLLLIYSLILINYCKATGRNTSLFDWSTIKPTSELRYHVCYDLFKCARLLVPLNWQNSTGNQSAAIAIITLPATVSEEDVTFGGTIITNPGGPGGSGVQDLIAHGQYIQGIADGNKHYEILSFDPRGVGQSTPSADCYNDEFARGAAALQQRGIGGLDTGPETLKRQFARAKAFGALCADALDVREFMSTAAVARDMVEIVDRMDELRVKTLLSKPGQKFTQHPLQSREREVARLQYFGFSYGTMLGNTFASMFPGRVGRMILDGVEDPEDYIKATWIKNLVDTEKVVEYFYETCFEADSSCPLRRSSDSSWHDMKDRVDMMIKDVATSPIPIVHNNQATIVTAEDVSLTFQAPLYAPIAFFSRLATVLADAVNGNYTLIAEQEKFPKRQDACLFENQTLRYTWTMDAAYTYICNDGDDQTQFGLSYFASYIQQLKKQSPIFGAAWAGLRFECSGWKNRPNWRFTGPFTTPEPVLSLREGHPAAPLLLLSAKIDPVTPLANAFTVSQQHPGSAVLVQESVGHCATFSSPSQCTKRIIQEYFETGTVPKNGTVCNADCKPWEPCDSAPEGFMISPIFFNNVI